MALDALRCNHLAPLGLKGLITADVMSRHSINAQIAHLSAW